MRWTRQYMGPEAGGLSIKRVISRSVSLGAGKGAGLGPGRRWGAWMEPLSASDPHTVGEFQLRARLGSGGMGQGYVASPQRAGLWP